MDILTGLVQEAYRRGPIIEQPEHDYGATSVTQAITLVGEANAALEEVRAKNKGMISWEDHEKLVEYLDKLGKASYAPQAMRDSLYTFLGEQRSTVQADVRATEKAIRTYLGTGPEIV